MQTKDNNRIDVEIEDGNETPQAAFEQENADTAEAATSEDQANPEQAAKASEQDAAESGADDQSTAANPEEEDWKTRYLRLAAEFDNFRKRTAREKQQLSSMAKENVLNVLFPAIDDLYRAAEVAQKTDKPEKIQEGIELTLKRLTNALKKQDVYRVEAKGEPFDSEVHEAIATAPAPDADLKGKVIEVLEHGYLHGEKVIRYAKVITGE